VAATSAPRSSGSRSLLATVVPLALLLPGRHYSGGVSETRLTWVQIVRLPEDGVAGFQEYEAAVTGLLADHGGRFDARYRGDEGRVEVHVVSFETREGMEAYMADERRQALRPQLLASGAQTELLEVTPVDV
jgi:hypothetical protein